MNDYSIETQVALNARDIEHLTRASQAHETHLTAHDERIRKLGSRVGQTADTATAHAREVAKIPEIDKRVATMEARTKERRSILQWAMAAAVPLISILLILAGAMGTVSQSTVDKVLPQLGKLK